MNIEVEMYKHKLEDECLRNMKKAIFCEETFASYHENFIEEAMKPDLVGKNVKVTEKQLSHIYKMVQEMSNILCIKQPDTYVFEDVNYNAYVKGVNKSWLEISAKTIERFNKNELRFLIGSQLAHIKSKHIYWNILMEQCIKAPQLIDSIYNQNIVGIINEREILEMGLKIIMYKWSRVAEYSSDACGYLLSGDITACVSAIKKIILNNDFLAKELNLHEYIKQSDLLEDYNSTMARYSKLDEQTPYGPLRIKELLRFASSSKAKEIRKNIRNRF